MYVTKLKTIIARNNRFITDANYSLNFIDYTLFPTSKKYLESMINELIEENKTYKNMIQLLES